MAIPKKALRESQLRPRASGSAAIDSSHEIVQVNFIEGGVTKTGFYKKLAPKGHYPQLLAQMSVATSVLKRLFQGSNTAEERLIFNDQDKVVGTLSLAIEGFRPFNYASEPLPSDPKVKELVVPSTQALVEKKAIRVLFSKWAYDDDDAHPHNMGFTGDSAADLDFDMYWYWFTIYMKEPRPGIGVPKKRVTLTVRDWESFPVVRDSKPYHWATYRYPGQETLPVLGPIVSPLLPKSYADPTQFEGLARDSKAHEQKFAEALTLLLTFDPGMVHARLTEHFGDLTLNYTSLNETSVELRLLYEKEFPGFCNAETNIKPFVDFMMGIYQEHYDSLYRVVVFYMGCANNGYGVSLPATRVALYEQPSFYTDAVAWVTKENTTTYATDVERVRYDLAKFQTRYHQIWRDAFAPGLKELLQETYRLTNKLRVKACSHIEISEFSGKRVTDHSLSSAWQLFGTMPELSKEGIEPLIVLDKKSQLREGLLLLVEFTNQLHAAIKTYYEKERHELTERDNLVFAAELSRLHAVYSASIPRCFAHTGSYAIDFNNLALSLKQFAKQVDFQIHLTTTDDQMRLARTATVVRDVLPHTHVEVVEQFNDSLFLWARSIPAEELRRHIEEIVDSKYTPYITALSRRQRAQPVKDFLAASAHYSGDNRLAYILSSGHDDTGALNRFLVQHLTPHMLKTYPLSSICNAVRDGRFETDIAIFTKATVSFAKYDTRFNHLYSSVGIRLFYKAMYEWTDSLSRAQFNGIIESALKAYEAQLWFGSSRRGEIERYGVYTSQAKILAQIFLNGAEASTLNDCLFQKIIAAIKLDVAASVEKQASQGYKLILQFNHAEHKAFYFEGLKAHALVPSEKPVAVVVAPVLASLSA